MIQYSLSQNEVEDLIEQEHPGWLTRAKERTNTFKQLGYYKESSSIWSEVKVVFMRIQHSKCAYCERQLESEEYGRIEHDLEHFRPKKKTKPWRLTKALKEAGVTLTEPAVGKADPGYHLLAYNPLNYCTSCKTCNSRLKSNYFPIEGKRSSDGDTPVNLNTEAPLLINPVGDYDHDPASLINFYGFSPRACGDTPYKRRRGLVSISFFHLDDRKRKYLFRERAETIIGLYAYLKHSEQAANLVEKKVWENLIQLLTKPSAPHTNCAQSFCTLYQKEKTDAKELFQLALTYLESISN
jgi:hypothetical protein